MIDNKTKTEAKEMLDRLQTMLDAPERPAGSGRNPDEREIIAENSRLEIECQAMLRILPKAAVRMATPIPPTGQDRDVLFYNGALKSFSVYLRGLGAVAATPVLMEAPIEVATAADLAAPADIASASAVNWSNLCAEHVTQHGASPIRQGENGPLVNRAVASETLGLDAVAPKAGARPAAKKATSENAPIVNWTERCRASLKKA